MHYLGTCNNFPLQRILPPRSLSSSRTRTSAIVSRATLTQRTSFGRPSRIENNSALIPTPSLVRYPPPQPREGRHRRSPCPPPSQSLSPSRSGACTTARTDISSPRAISSSGGSSKPPSDRRLSSSRLDSLPPARKQSATSEFAFSSSGSRRSPFPALPPRFGRQDRLR